MVFLDHPVDPARSNFVPPVTLVRRTWPSRAQPRQLHLWILGVIGGALPLAGGLDTVNLYTLYSTTTSTPGVIPVVIGVFILGSADLHRHQLRGDDPQAPPPARPRSGCRSSSWAIYATALIGARDPRPRHHPAHAHRRAGRPDRLFDPAMGGDPVLFHFFWSYSHPAVYIMILLARPSLRSSRTHRHIPIPPIAFSSVAIAIFSFLVWPPRSPRPEPADEPLFSAITFSVAIPSAIKVFNWLATLYKGSISLNTPMLSLGFIFLFTIGGLTAQLLNTDIHHDTYFVVAHFHYVMMGSALIAMIAGVHHWWPKMFGRMYNDRHGAIGFWLVFIGFNVTFFTQFMLGSHGMPRRYYDYQPEFQIYHDLDHRLVHQAAGFWTAYYLIASRLGQGLGEPVGRSESAACRRRRRTTTSRPRRPSATATTSVVRWDDEEGGYVVHRDADPLKSDRTDRNDLPTRSGRATRSPPDDLHPGQLGPGRRPVMTTTVTATIRISPTTSTRWNSSSIRRLGRGSSSRPKSSSSGPLRGVRRPRARNPEVLHASQYSTPSWVPSRSC